MTATRLLTIGLARDQDLIAARQRARQVAALVGLDAQDQARVATAVSEVARNALMYAGGGRMHVDVTNGPDGAALLVEVADTGPGIEALDDVLAGRYRSTTGMGLGLAGVRRLMDDCRIRTSPHGTSVTLVKQLPRSVGPPGESRRHEIAAELARRAPRDAYSEMNVQNQELARSLAELRERHEELARLNRELEDTNRGVVALYAELDEKAESLRRADDAKTRFLSSASHELRTPLSSIRSLAGLLLDRADGPLTEEQERQATLIRRAADGLAEMVDDLLDLAKIEAGKSTVRFAPVDIPALWSTMRGMMKPLLANADVTLVFDEAPAAELVSDEGKLAQVLRNLVANALKFTERGEVRVSAYPGDDRIVFRVSDTGIGIAPEHLDLVFEEFFQVENAMQRRHKGTGLGLPLCRRLAELLGGSITVCSLPGRGSTFTLDLPLQPPQDPASAAAPQLQGATTGEDADAEANARAVSGMPAAPAPTPATTIPSAAHARERILLVDDDDALRYALGRSLRARYDVVEAADGFSGLQAIAEHRPDIVVLDLQMPGMDGWELLDRLPPTAGPLVVLTGQQLDHADRLRLAARGAMLVQKGEDAPGRLLRLLSRDEPIDT